MKDLGVMSNRKLSNMRVVRECVMVCVCGCVCVGGCEKGCVWVCEEAIAVNKLQKLHGIKNKTKQNCVCFFYILKTLSFKKIIL